MNARIYLQPDAIPTQEMIRTANRLFRHFGKEVTFLQQQTTYFPDFTMNRLRWAICSFTGEASQVFDEALKKAPNLVIDFAEFDGDEN
jgi:hypothetical protein